MSVKSHEKGRPGPTHSVALDMTERAAGRAGSDLGRDRRPARRSILAGCMAGWRSGESGQTKRRRGNSQTWPTRACWRCGHGSHPATPSTGDSARRGAAPWNPAGSSSSSWWAGGVVQRVPEASVCASSGPSLVRLFVRSLTVPTPSQADTRDKTSRRFHNRAIHSPGFACRVVSWGGVARRSRPGHHRRQNNGSRMPGLELEVLEVARGHRRSKGGSVLEVCRPPRVSKRRPSKL